MSDLIFIGGLIVFLSGITFVYSGNDWLVANGISLAIIGFLIMTGNLICEIYERRRKND